jgi:Asp-tRNA(Asn)/Glu-tRNA(Gln) amidotransferase A subunit family amidase
MATYDLKTVKLPKLTRTGLRLFAAALDNPVLRGAMIGRLLQDGGITRLREMKLAEVPKMKPLVAGDAAVSAQPINLDDIAQQTTQATPFATIRNYAEAYRAGTITPVEVAERVLAAIVKSDEGERPLRAFITINREDVLTQACVAAARIQAGEALTVLDGVPVAIKDEVDIKGYPTTVGTKFLGRAPATADATVVARLRATGALLLGKTNMHEIGINPEGANAHHGTVRNPYHLDLDSGGSSSGSAAAVAAGFCPVAVGADGGGSIRIPAAHCGMVGLKATYGRVSEYGAAPLAWSVAHLGPIGAAVGDVALAYAVMAGRDEHDANTWGQSAVSIDNWQNGDLSGLKLGIFRDWFTHATPEIVGACETMLGHLVQAGAQVRQIEIPELDTMRIAHAVTILAEIATAMGNYPENWVDFAPSTRINLTLGLAATARDYVQAQRMRTRAMQIFAKVYAEVDMVVTPATAVTAPLIPAGGIPHGWSDLSTVTEVMRYVFPGNLIGLPALTFPVGYDARGLPISMQVMGRHWQEHVLFRVARVAEGVVERKRPSLFYDVLRGDEAEYF